MKQATDIGASMFCVYCGKPRIELQTCCGERHFTPLELCPECDSEDVIDGHGFLPGGPETFYKACCSCNHQWGHQ